MNMEETIERMEQEIEDLKNENQRINNEMVKILGFFKDLETGYNPYHHSSIYKITSPNTDKCYIGSTTKTLEERLKVHEKDFKRYKNNKRQTNTRSFEILEIGGYEIELLESVCCENVQELRAIEGLWQKKTTNRTNYLIAGRTKKEYRDEHKEEAKKYRDEHKEKTKEYNKKYKANAENKPKFKKYYDKNREKISEREKVKYTCSCGSTLRKSDKAAHNKTKKHLEYIKNNPN